LTTFPPIGSSFSPPLCGAVFSARLCPERGSEATPQPGPSRKRLIELSTGDQVARPFALVALAAKVYTSAYDTDRIGGRNIRPLGRAGEGAETFSRAPFADRPQGKHGREAETRRGEETTALKMKKPAAPSKRLLASCETPPGSKATPQPWVVYD